MAGDGVGDAAGLAVVWVASGLGVGSGGSVEGVALASGLGAGLDVADGRGRGDDGAAGLVDETCLVSGAAGAGPLAVGWACGGGEVGIAMCGRPDATARADDRPGSRGMCSTWMETAERARNAIAPADSTMTGTVLPAGWERTSVPTCLTVVLIRSAASASASCAAGSGGQ
jgi:hypothetical protein